MVDGRIDIDLLGAYVDGELDVEASARIAEAVARNPETARQVMLLSRLKSAASASLEDPAIDLPESAPRRRWLPGMAAGILGLLICGAAFWLAIGGDPGIGGQNDIALNAHRSWSVAGQGAAIDREVVLAAMPGELAQAYLPNLGAAKLKLVHGAIVSAGHGPMLVAGYIGSRGCRVTLLATAAGPEMAPRLDLRKIGGVLSARWRAGTLAYAMLARGMAEQRFRLIAASVSKASLKAAPMSPRTEVALAQSRARSKPCAIG